MKETVLILLMLIVLTGCPWIWREYKITLYA